MEFEKKKGRRRERRSVDTERKRDGGQERQRDACGREGWKQSWERRGGKRIDSTEENMETAHKKGGAEAVLVCR